MERRCQLFTRPRRLPSRSRLQASSARHPGKVRHQGTRSSLLHWYAALSCAASWAGPLLRAQTAAFIQASMDVRMRRGHTQQQLATAPKALALPLRPFPAIPTPCTPVHSHPCCPGADLQVELSEDTLKAVDIVRRIAEQVPAPEPLPEPADDTGSRKMRRPWMPEPIRKALSMLSPIYMHEVEQHGQVRPPPALLCPAIPSPGGVAAAPSRRASALASFLARLPDLPLASRLCRAGTLRPAPSACCPHLPTPSRLALPHGRPLHATPCACAVARCRPRRGACWTC